MDMQDNPTFVVSAGGSVLFNESGSQDAVAKFASVINELSKEGYRFVIVAGGGKLARARIEDAKKAGKNNFEADEAAINATRENASLLISRIENSSPEVLTDVKQAKQFLAEGKIPLYGGILPGVTTDFVAALIAELLAPNTALINLSNTAGVYSSDPNKDKNAEFFPKLNYAKLTEILLQCEMKPGQNIVFDLPACMLVKRSKIKTIFLDGNDLENFADAVRGKKFKGTVVQD